MNANKILRKFLLLAQKGVVGSVEREARTRVTLGLSQSECIYISGNDYGPWHGLILVANPQVDLISMKLILMLLNLRRVVLAWSAW